MIEHQVPREEDSGQCRRKLGRDRNIKLIGMRSKTDPLHQKEKHLIQNAEQELS